MRLVKGSHIVVPKLFEGEHAFILQNKDKRIVFAIPYQGNFTLIGTTDIPVEDVPGKVEISAGRDRRISATPSTTSSSEPVAPADVVWTYSGVRPLFDDGSIERLGRDPRLRVRPRRAGRAAAGPVDLRRQDHHLPPARRARARRAEAVLPGHEAGLDRDRQAARRRHAGCRFRALPRRADSAASPFLPRRTGPPARARLRHADRRPPRRRPRSMADLGEDFGGGLTAAEVDYLCAGNGRAAPTTSCGAARSSACTCPPDARERLDAYLPTKKAAAVAAQ